MILALGHAAAKEFVIYVAQTCQGHVRSVGTESQAVVDKVPNSSFLPLAHHYPNWLCPVLGSIDTFSSPSALGTAHLPLLPGGPCLLLPPVILKETVTLVWDHQGTPMQRSYMGCVCGRDKCGSPQVSSAGELFGLAAR